MMTKTYARLVTINRITKPHTDKIKNNYKNIWQLHFNNVSLTYQTKTSNMNTAENRLIADFLNTEVNNDGTYELSQFGTIRPNGDFKTSFTLEQMKFNKDWNWLMQVVDKIESLKVIVEIRENVCYIETSPKNYYSELEDTKLQATYKAVVEFIKWYNNQTN